MDLTNPSEQRLVKITKKRWLVLCLAVISMVIQCYIALCFGPVNNIVVSYFKVSYATSDWITLSAFLLSIAGFVLCAWLSYINVLNLKIILLLVSASLLIDASCVLVAFMHAELFFVMMIGQFVGGIAVTASCMFFFAIGAIWFPESEIALATGLIDMAWSMGLALSEILPETVLQVPNHSNTSVNYNNQQTNGTSDWFSTDQHQIEIIFLVIISVLILVLVCTIAFVPRLPEYPPSRSQAVKRLNSFKLSYSFKNFLKEVKELHQDRVYILIQLSYGFGIEVYIMLTIIMQQVVDDILSHSNISLNSSFASGLVLLCRSFGIVLLSPLSGMLLGWYKQYRLHMLTGITLSFLSTFGIFLSWFYASFVGQCLFMLLCGCSLGVYAAATYDALAQHTYPKNIMFISSCTFVFQFSIGVILSELARLIFFETGPLGVMIFYIFVKFLSVVFTFFIKPDLKRLHQEGNVENDRASERTPILSE